MAFFSRCDLQAYDAASPKAVAPRRERVRAAGVGAWAALAGFGEDLSILIRYAAGLDYYGRDRIVPRR